MGKPSDNIKSYQAIDFATGTVTVTETPPSVAHPQGSGGCNPQRRKTKVKKALIIRLSVADI
ncbi:hypothetical protein METP3_02696 [Methanosarcinales archaeon]|nr:hypothetical protein METP3_02696 [Methanosarcinales archaeon]